MRIYCSENYETMSRVAANIISAQIIFKPNCVLGLATGSTPIGAYKQLVKWQKKGDLSFTQVRSVNLDEYVGLSPEHSQSYRYFMNENLFKQVNINIENTNVPNGMAENPEEECSRYNSLIEELGGIDLQLLGIGHNGHIGFNEPEAAFNLNTHVVKLSETTIEANSRFFDNDISKVPTHAITMGIKSIMHARKILVVASGADKSDILVKTFMGSVMPEVPASILQMHPDVTLVGDKAALSGLINAGAKITL